MAMTPDTVVPWGRSFDECVRMFALSRRSGRIAREVRRVGRIWCT
jgi:hypothetical protein